MKKNKMTSELVKERTGIFRVGTVVSLGNLTHAAQSLWLPLETWRMLGAAVSQPEDWTMSQSSARHYTAPCIVVTSPSAHSLADESHPGLCPLQESERKGCSVSAANWGSRFMQGWPTIKKLQRNCTNVAGKKKTSEGSIRRRYDKW